MHFKKQPSWACCPRRRWQHWGRTWSKSSGYIEPLLACAMHKVFYRNCGASLAGRWTVSGWRLLGNPFPQRSLQQRRRSATILPPRPNYLSLLWWENPFSLVLIFWMSCSKIKHLSSTSSGNDVRLERLHRGWQKTQLDPKHFGHVRWSGWAAQKQPG